MAILWADLELGDDTTGDGSYATPYKTPNKCITEASAGDFIRIMQTSAHTTVSGVATFGFTDYSRTITTTADATGSFAVGDYIGKTTASGNGAEETFFRITAIDASSITLDNYYQGTTETQSSVLNATIASTGQNAYILFSDTATTSGATPLYVSGGWDTETTQAGETFVKHAGAFGAYGLIWNDDTNGIVSVDKLNFYNTDDWHADRGYVDFTDCSGICSLEITPLPATFTRCTIIRSGTANMIDNQDVTFIDCNLYGDGGVLVDKNNVANNITITGCKLCGWGYLLNINSNVENLIFDDNEVRNMGTYCFQSPLGGQTMVVTNSSFYNAATIVNHSTGCVGSYFKDCTFTDCTKIIYAYRNGANIYLDNCTLTNTDGVSTIEGYSQMEATFANCTFNNVPTYIAKPYVQDAGTTNLFNCSIDAASATKFITDPDTSHYTMRPRFIIHNCDTNDVYPDGSYFGKFALTKDASTYRTAAPSMRLLNKSTTTVCRLPFKLWSMYVKDGTGKKITFYHQESGGWSGEVKFFAYLNGSQIKEFPADSITTINSIWTKIELTIDDLDVTSDGELAIMATYTGNTIAVNFDDFSQVDV